MQELAKILNALSCEKRLLVLDWLKDPIGHFPPQTYGDLVTDGVCGALIAKKLKVTQPTTSRHMKILADVGLVKATRIGQWTFYKRNISRIVEIKKLIRNSV